MEKFNQKLKNYLTVYKVPIAPNSLDPMVFYFPENGEPPVLHPGIHSQILNDLEMFVAGQQPSRIKKAIIVGDSLVPGNKNRTSPIKVMIVLNKDIMDLDVDGILAEEVLKLAKVLSGRMATGALRKINYLPTLRDLDLQNIKAAYNISTNEWLKLPSGIQ
jgi:hypothetical protein